MNLSGTKQIKLSGIVKSTILFLVIITINATGATPQDISQTEYGQIPGPIIGDMMIVPENFKINSVTPLRSLISEVGFYDTSEYMIGEIAVGIIFVESNGKIDTDSQNWETDEENKVISEIKEGLNWWAAREPDAKLSFKYDIHYKVPTDYEPIGYGIENMDAVIAHETGHIFYALDQYYNAHQQCTKISGYLGVENQNSAYPYGACTSNVDSIMRSQISPYTDGALDTYARQQVGWKDADSDGIPDIIDFIPVSKLNPYTSDRTNDNTPTYSGRSTATATYPSTNPYGSKNAITINKIKDVQYRLDGASWTDALPSDGAFNSNIEDFTFTTPALSVGIHTIEVRALNNAGNLETVYANDTITINNDLIKNPGFESGKTPWMVYPNTSIAYSTVSSGSEGNYSAKLSFSSVPLGIQLYQPNIKTLEPNTRYRLSFSAYSTTGHDVSVKLKKTLSPYTTYGLDSVIDLGTAWQEYSVEFNTTIKSNVTDGCLQFYLYPFAKVGDIYYIDDVRLEKVIDTSPIRPVVVGNSPTGANVPITARISVNFSKPMNQSSVQAAFLTVPKTTGRFSWNGNNMEYSPDLNFSIGTQYNVTIGSDARDMEGNRLLSYSWQFITASPFSENLITNPGFESGKTPWMVYPTTSIAYNTVSPGSEGNYSAQLSFSSVPLGIQLYQPNIRTLEPNTRYRLTFAAYSTTGHDVSVKLKKTLSPYTSYGLDSMINLGTAWQDYSVEFNTTVTSNVTDACLQFYLYPYAQVGDIYYIDNVRLEKIVDTPPIPPEVIGNSPTGTNVPVTARISVNFSKPMNHTSAEAAFSTVPYSTGNFTWSGNNMIYTPTLNFSFNTIYNVTIGTGAMDSTGNTLVSSYNWQFTTIPDTSAPIVIGKTPTGNNEPVTTKITVTFSEAMNQASAESAFSTIPVTTGSFSWSGNVMTYTPGLNLGSNTTYIVTVGSGARDLAGNSLNVTYIWPFITGALDATPPTITGNTPTGNNEPVTSRITVTFSEAMNQTSVESAFSTSPSIAGSFSWSGNNMTYIPGSKLHFNTTYNVTIRTDAMDLAGNMLSSYNWQFTTQPFVDNLIINPSFESGKTPWLVYPTTSITYNTVSPGNEGNYSAKLSFSSVPQGIQLYQPNIKTLEPRKRYRLSFAAYSTSGHDVSVKLKKTLSPYTSYGLDTVIDLGTGWQVYSTEFDTTVTTNVTDACLQFYLYPFAKVGDTYFIDDVRLEKVIFNESTPPNITLWYGNSQRFGHIDIPQKWVNILGNAHDVSGIAYMNYSLNNGTTLPLSIGPDRYRLQSSGDFNIEINHANLRCGDNEVLIRAEDNAGNSKNETVFIDYTCNNVLPRNYNINWSDVTDIQDAAQIVDGLWIKEANSIRPAIIGYDRLITVGNMTTWDDYEVTAPLTLKTPLNSASPSGGPNFGFGMRWQGHYDSKIQPRTSWWPLGALGIYIWNQSTRDFRLSLIGNNMTLIDYDKSGKDLFVGITYIFKMRAQTEGSRTHYFLKVWENTTDEPPGWTISGYGPSGELKHGSITLNSHYSDVSFGNVTIKSGPFTSDMAVMGT